MTQLHFQEVTFSINSIYFFFSPHVWTILSFVVLCCDTIINNSGSGELIPTILYRGGDCLHATWAIFGELWFELFLEFYEIDIEYEVLFFDTWGGGIKTYMTVIRSQ